MNHTDTTTRSLLYIPHLNTKHGKTWALATKAKCKSSRFLRAVVQRSLLFAISKTAWTMLKPEAFLFVKFSDLLLLSLLRLCYIWLCLLVWQCFLSWTTKRVFVLPQFSFAFLVHINKVGKGSVRARMKRNSAKRWCFTCFLSQPKKQQAREPVTAVTLGWAIGS